MKHILLFMILSICISSYGKENIPSKEFVELLKENAHQKFLGTNDPVTLINSIKLLADNNDYAAQFLYGLVLSRSDSISSELYLSKSANSGCAGSKMALGVIFMNRNDTSKGFALIKAAAEGGDAMAQVAISGNYERGEHGLKKNKLKAYAWLKLAEKQTFSHGAHLAIKEALNNLSLSGNQLTRAKKEYANLSKKIKTYDYYFCGQMNLDTSKDPNIEYYFKI
ncbi:MAG: sel1 repeat family protein [Cellvibrio sp.]|nr:sel1 repeat family protein [Cellvibrio sp.]